MFNKCYSGSYSHLDIDEANFVPEAEKHRKNKTVKGQAQPEPDLLVEDAPPAGV